ncbi:MAG: uroporphyrinogen decarboxylase family protein [Candidatus Omnitrophota bacterium]
MTSKERFLTALRGGKPNHIPASPDTSNMLPCKLTGKPFWDIYLYKNPPLHQAYLEVLKKYGFDGGWEAGPGLKEGNDGKVEIKQEILEKTEEKIVVCDHADTPGGQLWQEVVYQRDNPPTPTRKYIKDVQKDFPLYLKYFYFNPDLYDDQEFQQWKKELGDLGVSRLCVSLPGLHHLVHFFDGGAEQLIYAYYDYPKLFREFRDIHHDWAIKMTRRIIQAKPDIILTGGSGTLVFQTPKIFRELGLPTLKEITLMAKEANIPTLIHSCGREKELVKICAEETDLSGINPLEVPPMGDCTLKELKEKYGDKLCLMGNLHTTDVMLRGTPKDVECEAKRAIDDAGANGGFILSTGDQCPRDTPEENLYKFIEVAKTYGKY